MSSFFTRQLLDWHQKNPRPLPWTGGPRDPYHIWISEVIMQQTRIEQGASYYHRFIARFPTIASLARASPDEVLGQWQGLGYYTRARNLHKAAQHIVGQLHGIFPSSYETLIGLPGIGPYSAAAIASFAYGLPHAVVDGNVKRLLSRFEGISAAINTPEAHALIQKRATAYMKGVSPAAFNQAIMNFGALVCKPKGALCMSCPLSKKCYAFTRQQVDVLPVSAKKKINTVRHLHFIVLHDRGRLLMERREAKDIWLGLYSPPVIESGSHRKPSSDKVDALMNKLIGPAAIEFLEATAPVQQALSHQTLIGRFYHYKLCKPSKKKLSSLVWVSGKTWPALGKPKMVSDMLGRGLMHSLLKG